MILYCESELTPMLIIMASRTYFVLAVYSEIAQIYQVAGMTLYHAELGSSFQNKHMSFLSKQAQGIR